MRLYSFEKLDVWKLSRKLTKNIYQISKEFPDDERFCLTTQIRKAATSISFNLAEGSSRTSGKDQARFTEISYGSLLEVLCQLIVANDLSYITESAVNNQRSLIEELGNKLNKLENLNGKEVRMGNKEKLVIR